MYKVAIKMFKVVINGTEENKIQINNLLNAHRQYRIDYALCWVNGEIFQVSESSNEGRFRDITAVDYRTAHAIVIFSETTEDFLERYLGIIDTISQDSKCAICVVSANPQIIEMAKDERISCINPQVATNLNAFLQTVYTNSQQSRKVDVGEYYNEIAKASSKRSIPTPQEINELILEYALPLSAAFNRSLLQDTHVENQYAALMREASCKKDPLIQIRLFLHYKKAQENEKAEAHFELALQYVLDIENVFMTPNSFHELFCLLVEVDEKYTDILVENFESRRQKEDASQPAVVESSASASTDRHRLFSPNQRLASNKDPEVNISGAKP